MQTFELFDKLTKPTMKMKAIITKRAGQRTEMSALSESNDAQKLELSVEYMLPQGTLVNGEEEKLSLLENQGYRVKLLPDTNILNIGDYNIDIEKDLPKLNANQEVPKSLVKTWQHHLVQLISPPNEEWIKKIEAEDVEVVEPISQYGLFVIGSPVNVEKLKKLDFVAWVGLFKPAYRIAPNLKGLKGVIKNLCITYVGTLSDSDFYQKLESLGAKIVSKSEDNIHFNNNLKLISIEILVSKLPSITLIPEVRWIEYESERMILDERSNQILAENLDGNPAPNTGPVTGYAANLATLGISGAGTIITIVDTGVDNHNNATMHQDLNGRMAFWVSPPGAVATDTNGHGTHVAGIAVGNGGTLDVDPQGFILGQGVAPGSQFGSINGISTGGSFSDSNLLVNTITNGSAVMNNSWGPRVIPTNYSARDRAFDTGVRDANAGTSAILESLIVVFAAGNSGPNAGTMLHQSKNPITVGNSLNFRPTEGDIDDIRGMGSTSSRGPATDGRILPTIVAPGTDIISARSSVDANPGTPGVQRPRAAYTDTGGGLHNNHTRMSGTSMAAPHVSGLCALLIEWWRNRTGGRNPSPALVKALLINGAIDIQGGPDGNGGTLANIPNNNQGWGRASLQNMVLQAPVSDRGPKIFSDQRHAFNATGQEHNLVVAPASTARPLRITLVWTDAPGAAGANPALVNDLDLEVREVATGNIYRGNVFNNGFSVPGGAFDNRNNVECVYIRNPSGLYEISVIAATLAASANPLVTTPWQDFALVIDNAEYAPSSPVNIVPVIDRSGSMVGAGYVDIAKTSSRQFVDLMNINDGLGIVSFGTTAIREFPAAAALETITGQPIRDAARTEIDGIRFSGCTFMGGGINEASSLLSSVSGTKAMVLLSDGYDNGGCNRSNPTALDAVASLPSDISVYSCAMGPLSDQDLLEQIATSTGGRYYYMPTIDDLFEIYNYIRSQVSGDSLIVNESAVASSSRVAGFVDALASEAIFSVSWSNTKLKYVSRDAKKQEEISIRLRDPRGRLIPDNDAYIKKTIGNGYVIFKIADPIPGQWYVEVSTNLNTHTRYTVGGFVNSPIKLITKLDTKKLFLGHPFAVTASVFDNGKQISQIRGATQIVNSKFGINTLLSKYGNSMVNINPDKLMLDDGIPLNIGKLFTLRNDLFVKEKIDILDVNKRKARLSSDGTGNIIAKFSKPFEKTSHNIIVNVSGSTQQTKFNRVDMISVVTN
jgi:subtilisin family serine protease/Mg-chelatase subunit ChlD